MKNCDCREAGQAGRKNRKGEKREDGKHMERFRMELESLSKNEEFARVVVAVF